MGGLELLWKVELTEEGTECLRREGEGKGRALDDPKAHPGCGNQVDGMV